MGCRKYRNALSEAAAGALAPQRRRRLDEHLAQCAECAARLNRLRRASELIHRSFADSAAAEPSPEWQRSIEQRLRDETASPRRPIPYGVLVAAATAVALIVAGWVLRGRFISPPPATAPTVPVTATAHRRATAGTANSEIATRAKKPTALRPARSTASPRTHARIARRHASQPDKRFFALVKVQPERQAIIRLYDLLQSGKMDPQSLLQPEQSVNKPIVIPPLRVKPLKIPPIDTSSDSGSGQGQSFGSGRSKGFEADANKEKTP